MYSNSEYSNQDFEFQRGTDCPFPKCKPKNIQFWCEEISGSTSIIDMIEHDYKIPFFTTLNSVSF